VIQRPQSLYLFLASALNLAVFFNPLYSRAMADPAQWIGWGLALSLTIALITAFVSIFLFKDRSRQLRIVKLVTYIQIVGLGFGSGVLFSLGSIGPHLWPEALGFLLVLLALAMLWLAGKGIKKDEELVQSMDRIR
jgi:CHASE2 domain-containing sensor protein